MQLRLVALKSREREREFMEYESSTSTRERDVLSNSLIGNAILMNQLNNTHTYLHPSRVSSLAPTPTLKITFSLDSHLFTLTHVL